MERAARNRLSDRTTCGRKVAGNTRWERRLLLLAALVLISSAALSRWPAPTTEDGGCGPTSLLALCRLRGLRVTWPKVARLFPDPAGVSSFAEIRAAGHRLGLDLVGQRLTLRALMNERPTGVLHISGNHFVSLVGYLPSGVRIVDPTAPGRAQITVWSASELSSCWDGRMLIVNAHTRVYAAGSIPAPKTRSAI